MTGKVTTQTAANTATYCLRKYSAIQADTLLLLTNLTGLDKSVFLTMFPDGDRCFSLLAFGGHPTHLIAVEPGIQPDTHHPCAGIRDGHKMFVGSNLAETFFSGVSPGNGRKETGISTTTFFV